MFKFLKLKKGKKLRKQKGSMIVEALIAATIITMSMLAIAPMFAVSVKGTKTSKEHSVTTNIAQQIIESIQSTGFDYNFTIVNKTTTTSIRTGNLAGTNPYLNANDGQISDTLKPGYKPLQIVREYRFVEGDNSTSLDDTIQIVVKITWPGGQNGITMATVLARDKL